MLLLDLVYETELHNEEKQNFVDHRCAVRDRGDPDKDDHGVDEDDHDVDKGGPDNDHDVLDTGDRIEDAGTHHEICAGLLSVEI